MHKCGSASFGVVRQLDVECGGWLALAPPRHAALVAEGPWSQWEGVLVLAVASRPRPPFCTPQVAYSRLGLHLASRKACQSKPPAVLGAAGLGSASLR